MAVLLVVFFHLVTIEQKYGGTNTILPGLFEFGMFGVDLFFVISGFVMVTVTRGKFQIQKQALRFIYHRVARIYPTYWFYTILVLFVFLIQPSWVNSSQGSQVDILASFLLLPSETLPLVMVGWTLIHEMYFYLIYFLILLLVSERNMPAAIILWGVAIVLSNIFLASASPIIKMVTHPLTIEFIAGCFLAIIYFKTKSEIEVRILLLVACLALIASLYGHHYYQNITGEIEPKNWWRFLIYGIPAILIIYCFTNIEKSGYVIHSSLIKIGDASYSIYLSHILTLSAAGRVWGMFSTNAVYDNIIMIPVLLLLAIMVGVFSYILVEKPLLRLSRRIA